MVLAIGMAFLSVAMFAGLYFSYQEIEKKRRDLAGDEWCMARASPRPAFSVRAPGASRSRKAERIPSA